MILADTVITSTIESSADTLTTAADRRIQIIDSLLSDSTNLLNHLASDTLANTPYDSVRVALNQSIVKMVVDPTTFWNELINKAVNFGLSVVAALLIYFVGAWAIKKLRKILDALFIRKGTERTLATFVNSFVTIVLTVMLVLVTIGTLGVDTSSFAALLTAGGLAVGMALSGTVQNFAGGVMLLIFRPFKAGDYIKAQGVEGTVMDVTIVATKIITVDHRVIVLPNGALHTGNIENVSTQPLRRVSWAVSLEYGTDVQKARGIILSMLAEDPRILNHEHKRPPVKDRSAVQVDENLPIPDPGVVLDTLNANDITFSVRAWVKVEDYWDVLYCFNERFYTELPQHGFQFAYPHMDVTLLNK